jgi:hypothetical protein
MTERVSPGSRPTAEMMKKRRKGMAERPLR